MEQMNRDRLLTTDMSRKIMAAILAHREAAPLLSDDHFPVDGALVRARASMKSFRPKDNEVPDSGNGPCDPPDGGRSSPATFLRVTLGPSRLASVR